MRPVDSELEAEQEQKEQEEQEKAATKKKLLETKSQLLGVKKRVDARVVELVETGDTGRLDKWLKKQEEVAAIY